MGYIDREIQILEILNKLPTITINDLIKKIYVSEATVRRDLKKLEEKGLILRLHGKIIKASSIADNNVQLALRENLQNPIKVNIA